MADEESVNLEPDYSFSFSPLLGLYHALYINIPRHFRYRAGRNGQARIYIYTNSDRNPSGCGQDYRGDSCV